MATFKLLEAEPNDNDYISIAQFREQTPETFYNTTPILHEHTRSCTLVLPKDKLSLDPALSKFTIIEDGEDALIKEVAVWVASEYSSSPQTNDNLILYSTLVFYQNNPSPAGVSIPFQAVALHATMKWKGQTDALYLNLSLNDAELVNNEDDILMLDITYEAMNDCAELQPDPNGSEIDEEDVLTAPGASGWITAENMDQFQDADGNFNIEGGENGGDDLGPGAGTIRPRSESSEPNGVNGINHEQKQPRLQ
jgi:chloride channel, nucleotide-sensitive, 1A